MKTVLLLSLFTLSLIAVDPGISIESSTKMGWNDRIDIGIDNATGARFLIVYDSGKVVSTLALPPIPPRSTPKLVPAVVPVVKAVIPSPHIEWEKITEIDPKKMDPQESETYVFEQDRPAQLDRIKQSGWRVVKEYNENGFNKYKLERLVPKAIEKK